jgi:hypothetical protein
MTDTQKTRAVFYAALVVFAVGVLVAMIATARAQDSERRDNRWATQRFCAHYDWTGHCTRYRYERRRTYGSNVSHRKFHIEPSERVYSYQRRYDDERDDRQRCHTTRSAVGDQHLTVEGAKKAANDAWAGLIRFHLGESAMDLSNAREVTYVCSRSSIKEGGVTTLGQTLTRCEVTAQPCRPLRLPAGEER